MSAVWVVASAFGAGAGLLGLEHGYLRRFGESGAGRAW